MGELARSRSASTGTTSSATTCCWGRLGNFCFSLDFVFVFGFGWFRPDRVTPIDELVDPILSQCEPRLLFTQPAFEFGYFLVVPEDRQKVPILAAAIRKPDISRGEATVRIGMF
jgi:hypothetical protein